MAFPKGVFSLASLVLLCLPSVLGMLSLVFNRLIGRPIQEWGTASSLFVASAVFFGMPLILMAIAVCAVVVLWFRVPPRVKSAHVAILGIGIIATLFVMYRPGF